MPEQNQPHTEINLIRIWGIPLEIKNNDEDCYLKSSVSIIEKAGLTIIDKPQVKPYPIQGLAFHALLSESGITGYTWPERDYMDYLLHTCVEDLDLLSLADIVKEVLRPKTVSVNVLLKI